MKRAKQHIPPSPTREDYRLMMELVELAEGLHANGVVSDESLVQICSYLPHHVVTQPLTQEFVERLRSLVDGVEVDLDKPLDNED